MFTVSARWKDSLGRRTVTALLARYAKTSQTPDMFVFSKERDGTLEIWGKSCHDLSIVFTNLSIAEEYIENLLVLGTYLS